MEYLSGPTSVTKRNIPCFHGAYSLMVDVVNKQVITQLSIKFPDGRSIGCSLTQCHLDLVSGVLEFVMCKLSYKRESDTP